MPADQPEWVLAARRALGDRIRSTRMWRNLTQEKLAELSGIDRSTIQRIERGTSDSKVSHLLLIARALDIHVTDLLQD